MVEPLRVVPVGDHRTTARSGGLSGWAGVRLRRGVVPGDAAVPPLAAGLGGEAGCVGLGGESAAPLGYEDVLEVAHDFSTFRTSEAEVVAVAWASTSARHTSMRARI
jgi:hypothetical protein